MDDLVVIIFISGISGWSKFVFFSYCWMIGVGIVWLLWIGMFFDSKCYIILFFYYGNGLVVVFFSCVEVGVCVVVCDCFLVWVFLSDVWIYNCDLVVYIGELWCYLS